MSRTPSAAPPGGVPSNPLDGAAAIARDSLRGAALMTASMACFSVEDAIIKVVGGALPPAQIIWMLGLGGAIALWGWLWCRDRPVWSPEARRPIVLWRTAFEVGASLCFVPALVLVPLSTATAILQAGPLVVAAGAALVYGAQVGPRRWAAIGAGFAGVLLIVRPGAAFEPAVLLAVAGTLFMGARDLVTRRAPVGLSSTRLSLLAFLALVPTAAALQVALGAPFVVPSGADALRLVVAVFIGIAGYVTAVVALRMGDVAVVSSFRYARMVFALVLALVVFRERPDALALLGIAVIVGAGLYTLIREARLARAASMR